MSFYWITRLDAIFTIAAVLGTLLLFFSAVMFFIGFADKWSMDNEDERINIKITRRSAITGILFILVAIFTPTTKQACAIYFVDYLRENKDARELPDKVIKSANLYFDDLIEKMEEHNTERE